MEHKHLVYGKAADTGTTAVYTDVSGIKYPARVKRLEPPVYYADLEVQMDGAPRFIEHVPFNEGAPGSWTHMEEKQAPAAEPEVVPEEVAEPAKPTKKSGK